MLIVYGMLSAFVFGNSANDESFADERQHIDEVIQVNVLNGCGEPGIASQAKNFLRAHGFDVVEIGNYSEKVDRSLVIDRLGNNLAMKKVANTIGISDSLSVSRIDSSMFLQATIVLGKDYKELVPFN